MSTGKSLPWPAHLAVRRLVELVDGTLKSLKLSQPETDSESVVDQRRGLGIDGTKVSDELAVVNRANLIERHDRIDTQPGFTGNHRNAGWCEARSGRDCGGDGDRAVFVGDVVLQDKSWAGLLDFRAQRWASRPTQRRDTTVTQP